MKAAAFLFLIALSASPKGCIHVPEQPGACYQPPADVPEPGTFFLIGGGLAAVGLARKCRKK